MNGLNNFFWKCTGMFELFSLSVLARIFLTILIELGLSIVHTVVERHGIRHYLRYDKKKHTFRVVFWRV